MFILSILLGFFLGYVLGYCYRTKEKTYKGPDSSVIRVKTFYIKDDNGIGSCYKFKPIPVVGPIIHKKYIK